MRGLKYLLQEVRIQQHLVAPFMGAWIEIMQGLANYSRNGVAPFMGAWIEICIAIGVNDLLNVAPFMGAWIEIHVILDPGYGDYRRTLYGCVD